MLLTSVFAEIETSVVFERPNVATSFEQLGTTSGVQFTGVFQSPEIGSRFHWAMPYVTVGTRNMREQRIAAAMRVFIEAISIVLVGRLVVCRTEVLG
jgi:hypothetical protein